MHIDELQNVHVQDEVHQIYLKYQFYELVSEKDLEYTKKLNDRIIKIFSFFKWKSKNQFVLNLIEQNIQTKLNNLYDKKNLGDIIKFIMDSVSKGSLIKQK